MADMKVQGEFEMDTTKGEDALARVESGARRMASTVKQAGDSAANALGGMGDKAEQSARVMERANAALATAARKAVSEQQRAIVEAQGYSLKSAEGLEELARVRGGDVQAIQGQIGALRELRSQHEALVASQRAAAGTALFEQQHAAAKKLVQDAEYVRMWTSALDVLDAKQRELAALPAFERDREAAEQARRRTDAIFALTQALDIQEARERELAALPAFQREQAAADQARRRADATAALTQVLDQQEAAERRLATQNGFLASLKSQSDGIGKTRSELLALQAAQLGVSDKAAPMIARLREQEAGFAKLGTSAGQTRAALAQLPMQFSDIVVSLQGGQAPLTVFLQQGAQIKDSFGGAGAALKAMGGYVLGLINPLTLGAATAAALAVAYNQGSKEAQGYSTAIISTGNAAGTTAAQMTAYAQAVSASVGTQGKAAEAITELVSTGKVAASVLRDAGAAAVYWEQATGQAVSKTAEQFASLRADPLAAVLKLNEGMNFLTESTYRQIKSLSDQGKTADAARVAQEAYADALTGRARQIEQNLGYIETGWKRVKDAAKAGWDAMLNVGRASTPGDALTELRSRLEAQQRELAAKRSINPAADTSGLDKGIEVLKQRIGLLESDERQLRRNAEAEAARAAQVQAAAQWDKEGVKYLSDKAKLERDLTQAMNEGAAAGRSKAEIDERLAKIREEYAKKGGSGGAGAGQSEVAQIRARVIETERYLQLLRTQGAEAEKLTEGEKLVIKIKQDLKTSISGVARAEKERALVAAEQLAVADRAVANEKQRIDGLEKSRAAYAAVIDETRKTAQAIGQQADELEAANAVWGKSKTAVEEYRLALVKAKLAEVERGSDSSYDPAYVAALREQVAAQERKVNQSRIADYKAINEQTDEIVRNAREMASLYEDESRLAGLTGVERAKVVALRQVELKYAKELDKIEKSGLSDLEKENQRRKLLEAKQIESQAAVSKVVEEDWNKTSQLIGDTLADYIMGGGKDAAQYLKRLFATLVLQPTVQTIVGSILGTGSGVGAASGIAGGGIGNIASGASSLIRNGLNVAGMGGQGLQRLADMAYNYGLESVGEMVDQFRYGMMDTASWAGFQEAFQQGGARLAGAVAGSVLNGFSGYGLSRLISGGYQVNSSMNLIGGIASAIPGIGPIAGVVTGAINRLFGRKLKDMGIEGEFGGESGFEGRTYQFYKGGLFRSNKTKYGELDEELRAALGDQFNTMRVGTAAMAEVLGLGTDAIDNFTASIKVSFNGLDEAGIQKALKEEFDKVAETLASATLGTAEFNRAGETSVEALVRLSSSLATVNGVFENLGETLYASSLAGADMASSLLDLFGGADGFNAATSTYFQNYYSPEEQRAAMQRQLEKQLATLDLKLPDINAADARAQFRALAEAQDLTTESGRKAYAMLLQLAGSFASITDAASSNAEELARIEAERQKKIADTRAGLDERLLAAQGNDRGVLDLRRKQEYDALYKLDPALAELVSKIYALEDASKAAAEAAARAAEIESKGFDLTQRLLIAEGRDREALDLRRKQEFDALYKLDPALAAMVSRIYELEDAAQRAADAEAARGNALRDLSDAMGRQREVWEGQLEAIDTQRQVQQEALGLITGIFDLVRSNARDLYGEVGATAAMQASQGNAFIAQALATAKRTGYLPEQDALQEAISAARGGLDANNYATQVDADFARLVLAGQLKGLEDIAGPQKTAAEQQIERLDAQTETLQRLIREQQREYDLLQRQVDIANGTYNATITVAEATAKIIELLGGKKPAGNASGDGGAAWGGSAPTPAGTGAKPAPAKYSRVFWAGGSTAGYEAIRDQSLIDRLDKLAPVYHSFDGTGNLLGLAEAFKGAGGTIADLSILSGNYEADWRKAFASVGIPAFAVGTNYVPYDTPAVVHKGERIIPAADNRALMAAVNAGGQGNTARLEALVQQLVEDNRLQAGEILRLQNRLAKVIEKWDGDGLPQERDEAVTA